MTFTNNQIEALTIAGLGLFVVFATSFLKNINFSKKTKHAIAFILSILTGFVSSYFQKNGTTNLEDAFKHSTYLYAVSQVLYVYALQNTKVDAWLTKFNILPSSKNSGGE